jgi:hypothetical protein
MNKIRIKEVHKWMKTLEENKYKKIYNSDVRRVTWFVNNNMSEDYESMPKSVKRKRTESKYGRERYLAKKFLEHKTSEEKLRNTIREAIRKLIGETK